MFQLFKPEDVDECQNEVCGENAICSNIKGSYTCYCMEGFEMTDRNKCKGWRLLHINFKHINIFINVISINLLLLLFKIYHFCSNFLVMTTNKL